MLDLTSTPKGRTIARARNHIYLRPTPALAPYIAHYTITHPALRGEPVLETGTLTLMPDLGGCFVYSQNAGEWARFWGAYTSAVPVANDFDNGPPRFFVEFRPGGASRLMGLSMKAFTGGAVPAGLVHSEVHKHIAEAVVKAEKIGPLANAVDAVFLRLLFRLETFDTAASLIPLLAKLTSTRPVGELAQKTGYSERQLARIFNENVGVGVKAATRVVRLNRMLQFLQPGVSLTMLAQQAGYYDQSHLDHDFKAICGVTPSEYLKAASDFYKEEYKG